MNRILITYITFLLSICSVKGQLEPLQNQYILNGLAINPAFAGADEALSITLLQRNQWVGFEGAPVTSTLAIHSPLRKENLALGFQLMHDQIGITKNTSFTGSYAYRIITNRGIISLGLGTKLNFRSEAIEKIRQIDTDDEYIPKSSRTYLLPDFNVGIYYKTNQYYTGISIVSILGSRLNSGTGKLGINPDLKHTNYIINGGFFASLSEMIKINPGLLVKFNLATNFQADLYSNLVIKDKFWIGMGYRSRKGLIWILQFQVNYQARIAYSYGMDFSTLGHYQRGSHEIMLKYVFNYLVEVVSPRQY